MSYKFKHILVVNHSTVIDNSTLARWIVAVQTQVYSHFGPVWGINAELKIGTDKDLVTSPDAGVIYIVDTPDQKGLDGVLGYHDYTPQGNPVGYVFAKTDLDYHLSPSVTFSHEVLEMLGDVFCSWCTLVAIGNTPTLYSIEVCDAVEDDSDGYLVNGVQVSNFVYPDWFEPASRARQFDFRHELKMPLEIRPGGYMSIFRIGVDKEWTNIDGGKATRLEVKKQTRPTYTRMYKRNRALEAQSHMMSLVQAAKILNLDKE